MRIKVENIELTVLTEGYRMSFYIVEEGSVITFSLKEAPAICDALKNLIEVAKAKERKNEKERKKL